MKTNFRVVFVVLAIAVMVGSMPALAEEKAITINPLGFAFGLYNAEYETKTSEDMSLTFSGLYWAVDFDASFSMSMLGVEVGIKKYLRGQALEGFYIGGSGMAGYANVTDGTDSGTATVLGASGFAGYKFVTGGGFVVDVRAGISKPLYTAASSTTGSDDEFAGGPFGTSIGVNLGYAW